MVYKGLRKVALLEPPTINYFNKDSTIKKRACKFSKKSGKNHRTHWKDVGRRFIYGKRF